jgi:hypothetical protein
MKLDEDQLEWIVREVVRRINLLCPPAPRGEGGGEGGAPPQNTALLPNSHLTLTATVITTATLEHQLQGVTHVTAPARAVITPAARDLLKDNNIQFTRDS